MNAPTIILPSLQSGVPGRSHEDRAEIKLDPGIFHALIAAASWLIPEPSTLVATFTTQASGSIAMVGGEQVAPPASEAQPSAEDAVAVAASQPETPSATMLAARNEDISPTSAFMSAEQPPSPKMIPGTNESLTVAVSAGERVVMSPALVHEEHIATLNMRQQVVRMSSQQRLPSEKSDAQSPAALPTPPDSIKVLRREATIAYASPVGPATGARSVVELPVQVAARIDHPVTSPTAAKPVSALHKTPGSTYAAPYIPTAVVTQQLSPPHKAAPHAAFERPHSDETPLADIADRPATSARSTPRDVVRPGVLEASEQMALPRYPTVPGTRSSDARAAHFPAGDDDSQPGPGPKNTSAAPSMQTSPAHTPTHPSVTARSDAPNSSRAQFATSETIEAVDPPVDRPQISRVEPVVRTVTRPTERLAQLTEEAERAASPHRQSSPANSVRRTSPTGIEGGEIPATDASAKVPLFPGANAEFGGMQSGTVAPAASGRASLPVVAIPATSRISMATLSAERPQRLTLEVNPPELGRCELELSLHGDRIRATIVADRPETVAALHAVEGQVREQLAARDLHIVEFEVRSDAQQTTQPGLEQGSSQGGRHRHQSAPQATAAEARPKTAPVHIAPSVASTRSSAIDLMA